MALYVHVKAIHRGVKLQCDVEGCDKSFDLNGELNLHKKQKHEKYHCNQCDFQASSSGYLNIHVKKDHEGIRYKCEECGKLLTCQKTLRLHTQRRHFKLDKI